LASFAAFCSIGLQSVPSVAYRSLDLHSALGLAQSAETAEATFFRIPRKLAGFRARFSVHFAMDI
jgi:hypothetical protein